MNLILTAKIGGVICAIGGVVATAILIPWSGGGNKEFVRPKTVILDKNQAFVYAISKTTQIEDDSVEAINHSDPNFKCRVVTYDVNSGEISPNNISNDDLFDCSLSKIDNTNATNNESQKVVVDVKKDQNNQPNKGDLNTSYRTFQIKFEGEVNWNKLSTTNNAIQIVSTSNPSNIYATLYPSFAKYNEQTKVFNEISFIGKALIGQGEKLNESMTITSTGGSSAGENVTTQESWQPKIFDCKFSSDMTKKESCQVVFVSPTPRTDDIKTLLFNNIELNSESSLEPEKYYFIAFMEYASSISPNVSAKPLPELGNNATISLYEKNGNDLKIEFINITPAFTWSGHSSILLL